MSDDHFSVDGTLIEAWASHKSFQPKPGGDGDGAPPPADPKPPSGPAPSAGRNAEQNWRGQTRSSEPLDLVKAIDDNLDIPHRTSGQANGADPA